MGRQCALAFKQKKIRYAIFVAFLCFLQIIGLANILGTQKVQNSPIVKVYSVCAGYDYLQPGEKKAQENISGSGCIIRGNRILTNAHIVADAIIIQVKRAGTADKTIAKVEYVAHDCDLAVLKVDSDSFFQGVTPLEVGELPGLGDTVSVYGFPKGGDELCVTQGIVSRVEHRKYVHSQANLLSCQIDAAVNSGNSGGPVISNGKIVGIAFQSLAGQNISYVVPVPVINHFFEDIMDGKYDGIPGLEISWQRIENPDMKAKNGLKEDNSGVLIKSIFLGSPAMGILRPGDIILAIEGQRIACDGTIEFREGERTTFEYLIQRKFIGNMIAVDISRDSKIVNAEFKLNVPINYCRLVAYKRYDRAPTYLIVGGLVFQPLTSNYLEAAWEKEESYPFDLEYYNQLGEASEDRQEVVVLTHVIADKTNIGYHDYADLIIVSVNGKKISNMKDLVRAVDENQEKYYVFVEEGGKEIVLERWKVQRNFMILDGKIIGYERSKDLIYK